MWGILLGQAHVRARVEGDSIRAITPHRAAYPGGYAGGYLVAESVMKELLRRKEGGRDGFLGTVDRSGTG